MAENDKDKKRAEEEARRKEEEASAKRQEERLERERREAREVEERRLREQRDRELEARRREDEERERQYQEERARERELERERERAERHPKRPVKVTTKVTPREGYPGRYAARGVFCPNGEATQPIPAHKVAALKAHPAIAVLGVEEFTTAELEGIDLKTAERYGCDVTEARKTQEAAMARRLQEAVEDAKKRQQAQSGQARK
jgi:hypothetical protein